MEQDLDMTTNSIVVWQVWDESNPAGTGTFCLIRQEAEEIGKTHERPKIVSDRVVRSKKGICEALNALPKRCSEGNA